MISRFVFSGTGGQGVITAAILLAEAAIYYEQLNAVQTQTYGAEARGGAARADVIISSEEIKFPKVVEPDVLICLSQLSFDKYSWIVRPGGFVVLDQHFVHRRQSLNARCVELPLHDTVLNTQGDDRNLNLALLGALASLVDFIRIDAIRQVVVDRFGAGANRGKLEAVEIGHGLVSRAMKVF
jgi:2-oxoglutarate ferredoxin oxidoreductase subunit gamma